jgi:hypothetical protein
MKKFFLAAFALFMFLNSTGLASDGKSLVNILKSDEDFIYNEYFTVKDDPRLQNINLLALDRHTEKFPLPALPYNRDQHFGGWLRDVSGETCLNTRGLVLVRDSLSSVTYTSSGCTVDKGEWDEPYTARLHTSAKDIQIDHLVALKNAYMTGAHEWNTAKRCLYANFMGNKFHLLSTNGKENLKKSDHTPSGYIPPNKAYTCQFIKQWLNVKLIWSLRLTPKEITAINKIAADSKCNAEDFVVTSQSLKEQRDYMTENADLCNSTSFKLEKF